MKRVVVTKRSEKRIFTESEDLLRLDGDVITDFEYDEMSRFEKRDFDTHAFRRDILVYFPIHDFCYWLAVGEYELIKA